MNLVTNLKMISILSVTALVAACGGGGNKSNLTFGERDATSSKNSVSGTSQGARQAKPVSTQANSYSTAYSSLSSSAMSANSDESEAEDADEWEGSGDEKSGSGRRKCKIQGDMSLDYKVDSDKVSFNLTGSECLDEKDGGFSGTMAITMPMDFSSLTINGNNIEGIGLNAQGKYAKHNLSFENVTLPLDFNFDGESAQLNCTGSIVIDGVKKDCKEAFIVDNEGEPTIENNNEPSIETNGSGRLTNIHSTLINGAYKAFFAVEQSGAKIIGFSKITGVLTTGERGEIDGEWAYVADGAVGSELRARSGDIVTPPAGFLDDFTSNGRILYVEFMTLESVQAIEVEALLEGGGTVTIFSK